MQGIPAIGAQTPLWLALLTTGVGAVQGALLSRKTGGLSVDFVGAAVFALFLGRGGGFARDAIDFDVSWVGSLLVGCFASVTGGVVVSLLRREAPALLTPGLPCAILAVAGSAAYLLLEPANGAMASLVAVTLVVLLRWFTVGFGIKTSALKAFDGDEPGAKSP